MYLLTMGGTITRECWLDRMRIYLFLVKRMLHSLCAWRRITASGVSPKTDDHAGLLNRPCPHAHRFADVGPNLERRLYCHGCEIKTLSFLPD